MNKKYLCIQILSRDSVTVSVDAVVYFNVIDAELALCSVDDFRSVLKHIFFIKHLARPTIFYFVSPY